jgi:hypothetical protein
MAERIVSPGVFTRENDLSFLAQGVGEIGAAFIGPFKQGPAFIPTIVRTQSEFEDIFGTPDGTYYTEYAVQNYLREAGTATIVRVGGIGGYQQPEPFALRVTGSAGGNNSDGRIFRSTDFGQNYSSVLSISDSLFSVKYMPAFRHASYLSVVPFLAVGNGRIVTNSVTDCSSWITISSPTTNSLYGIEFNNLGVGIIVGQNRILKTNTNARINAWSIVNSVTAIWRDVASDGSVFVAVGDNGSIITGNSFGTTWTTRSMPPLSPSGIDLYGITYHTDGFFYAVGSTSSLTWYIMRSSDQGVNWTSYIPTDFALFDLFLSSIKSSSGRLVIGGVNYQYQIRNDVVTRCNASVISGNVTWNSCVKDANSNGFDMAGGIGGSSDGAYSNF